MLKRVLVIVSLIVLFMSIPAYQYRVNKEP